MTDSNFPAAPGAVQAEPPAPPGRTAPDRNLALELARVTEAGAMAAARWVGRGDKNGADGAAVQAMRRMFSATGRRMSTESAASGPVTSLSM